MIEPSRPRICPVMQKMITLIVQRSQFPGLLERGQLIDQLTDLEAEGIAQDAPWRTLEAIRAARMKLRVEGLMAGTPLSRGQ